MTTTPTFEIQPQTQSHESLSTPLTAGQLLRAARLQAGVHLAVLSVTLKVPIKQLEALESDELDPAKGPVFFRGLTSAVCRHLHTDPAPILALLPVVPGNLVPQRTVGAVGSVTQRSGPMHFSYNKSRKSVLWGAAAMLVLIAALIWLPSPSQWLWLDDLNHWVESQRKSDEAAQPLAVAPAMSESQGGDSQETKNVAEAVAAPVAVSMVPVPPTAVPVTATPAAAPSPISVPSASALPSPSQASAGAATVTSQAVSSAASKTGSVEWVFSASIDSWIELRRGPNTVVWSGLVKAGQSQRVLSPLPVSVVVGRAQGVTVTLRGQAFDLKPHTQVTVARFEVKE